MTTTHEILQLVGLAVPPLLAVAFGEALQRRRPSRPGPDKAAWPGAGTMLTAVSGNAVGGDLSVHAAQHIDHSRTSVHHYGPGPASPAAAESADEVLEFFAVRVGIALALVVGAVLLAQQLALALWASAYVVSLVVALFIGLRYRSAGRPETAASTAGLVTLLGVIAVGAWLFDERVHSTTWHVAKLRLEHESSSKLTQVWHLITHGNAGVEVLIASLCAVGLAVAGLTAAWLVARRLPTPRRPGANSGVTPSPRALWFLCGLSILFAMGITDESTSYLADALHSTISSKG